MNRPIALRIVEVTGMCLILVSWGIGAKRRDHAKGVKADFETEYSHIASNRGGLARAEYQSLVTIASASRVPNTNDKVRIEQSEVWTGYWADRRVRIAWGNAVVQDLLAQQAKYQSLITIGGDYELVGEMLPIKRSLDRVEGRLRQLAPLLGLQRAWAGLATATDISAELDQAARIVNKAEAEFERRLNKEVETAGATTDILFFVGTIVLIGAKVLEIGLDWWTGRRRRSVTIVPQTPAFDIFPNVGD